VDTTDFVCVRAMNGLKVSIQYGVLGFWLQKWDDEERKFLNLADPSLPGAVQPVAYVLQAGAVLDRYLPHSSQPLSAGRYRAFFRFSAPGQTAEQEVYSEQFTLS